MYDINVAELSVYDITIINAHAGYRVYNTFSKYFSNDGLNLANMSKEWTSPDIPIHLYTTLNFSLKV